MGGCSRLVPQNCVTKTDIFGGLYRIRIFVFLTPLEIFVPCLGILFFINHYFLVCIFNYCTSLRIILGHNFRGAVLFKQYPQEQHKKRI